MTEDMEREQSMGERLLTLRSNNHYTQEDLAEQLNVSRQSISKWELNKALPDVEKLVQLSEMYKVSIDYLVMGREKTGAEEEDKKEGQAEEELRYVNKETFIRKTILLISMILSGVLFFCMVFFAGRLLMNQTFYRENKSQEVTCVEKIYEQYTKAEVSSTDDTGVYSKRVVWLDTPGVRENDYIYCYVDGENANQVTYEYYFKTLLFPVVAGIIFLIFFIVMWMEWRSIKQL
jgi:transcriptional regulator with XRE-family HTH domain